ncbi:MAG: hypothetical protein LBR37_04415, partial [Erysipelotrichaceae bacterium]|nr:hypothetical protein [Erysipelotrichaceae bacterium]
MKCHPYFAPQIYQKDCLIAALKTYLATAAKDQNYLYLGNPHFQDEKFSFYDAICLGAKHGFTLKAYETTFEQLIKQVPCLINLNLPQSVHSVYLHQVKKNQYCFFDPLFGKTLLDSATLASLFSGRILKITAISRQKTSRRHRLFKKATSFTILVQVVSFLVTLLCCYFFQESS